MTFVYCAIHGAVMVFCSCFKKHLKVLMLRIQLIQIVGFKKVNMEVVEQGSVGTIKHSMIRSSHMFFSIKKILNQLVCLD